MIVQIKDTVLKVYAFVFQAILVMIAVYPKALLKKHAQMIVIEMEIVKMEFVHVITAGEV